MKKKIVHTSIIIMSLVIIILGVFLFILKKNSQKQIDAVLTTQDELLQDFNVLKNAIEKLSEELVLQSDSSSEALNTFQETLGEQLVTVSDTIDRVQNESQTKAREIENQIAIAASSLSDAIATWVPRIARVRCLAPSDDSDSAESYNKGSGVMFLDNGVYKIMSNAHVLDNDDDKNPLPSEKCKVSFDADEDSPYEVSGPAIQIVTGKDTQDIGVLTLGSSQSFQKMDFSKSFCAHTAAVGDEIVVIGYPTIGAEDSPTVTEGVIAGLEDDYYVTSANISQGSSGGAAIDIKKNCYLGIPTFVRVDKTGSLGRILKVEGI